MKVGMVLWPRIDLDINASGGIETVAMKLLKLFNENKIEANIYARKVVGENPQIIEVKKKYFFGYGDYIYFAKVLMKNQDSDVILGFNCPKVGLFAPKKTVIRYGNIPWLPFYKYKIARDRYKQMNFVFCSNFLRKEFIKKFPELPKKNAHTIHNGVDISEFKPMQKDNNSNKIKILFLGQWTKIKGIFTLIDAIKILEKKRNDFEVLLVGSSNLWKNEDVDVERRLEGEKINHTINKLKSIKSLGVIKHDKLPQIYNSADITIVPSISPEAFGNVNIESMACGTPVIGTHAGGIPEIIEDKKTGLLIEPNNPQHIINSIEYLIDNENERRKMGELSRKRVEKHFNWEEQVKEYLGIFNQIYESNKHH